MKPSRRRRRRMSKTEKKGRRKNKRESGYEAVQLHYVVYLSKISNS
jgi:hypothetical protein